MPKSHWWISIPLAVISFGCGASKTGDMPDFNILLDDSTTILNTQSIPSGQPIILLFFSPDCEHCQEETKALIKEYDAVKNYKIYFITIEPFRDMRYFKEYFHLGNYSNITVGRDYTFAMPKYYQLNTTPFMVIYNKEKRLQVIVKGTPTVEEIVKLVKKNKA